MSSRKKMIIVLICALFPVLLIIRHGDTLLFRYARECQISDGNHQAYNTYITILKLYPKTSYSELIYKNLSTIVLESPDLYSKAVRDIKIIEKVFPFFSRDCLNR